VSPVVSASLIVRDRLGCALRSGDRGGVEMPVNAADTATSRTDRRPTCLLELPAVDELKVQIEWLDGIRRI
jgi:hypothetical protein